MNGGEQIHLYTSHRVGLAAVSILLLLLVLELVRRGYLKERYALLWLLTSLFGLIVGIFPSLIVRFAEVFRFQFLTMVFVLSFIFIVGIVLSFSVVISRLAERNRRLTQEVALLGQVIRKLEKGDGD